MERAEQVSVFRWDRAMSRGCLWDNRWRSSHPLKRPRLFRWTESGIPIGVNLCRLTKPHGTRIQSHTATQRGRSVLQTHTHTNTQNKHRGIQREKMDGPFMEASAPSSGNVFWYSITLKNGPIRVSRMMTKLQKYPPLFSREALIGQDAVPMCQMCWFGYRCSGWIRGERALSPYWTK